MVAGSFLAAVPAHATTAEAYVQSDVTEQYGVSCTSAATCNTITTGTEVFPFGRTGSTTSALGIYYKIVDNGGAVNGVDFSTPATGEVIIPAGQSTENLSVPLLDSGLFDTYVYFTVEITGTTTPITLENTTATGGFYGGNIPSDCSFTWGGGLSLALGCTARPPTQVWNIEALCGFPLHGMFGGTAGTEVTGDGTSTVTCTSTIETASLDVDS